MTGHARVGGSRFPGLASVSIRLLLALQLALLCSALSSCSLPFTGDLRRRVRGPLVVRFSVSKHLNENSPIAVDLVLVNDKDLGKEILKMAAEQWFEGREQFRRDHAESRKTYSIASWELVPNQVFEEQRLPWKSSALQGVVFARYLTPGDHREVFNPKYEGVFVLLGEDDFELREDPMSEFERRRRA